MKTNDCLRRLRYILELDDNGMIAAFAEGGATVDRPAVSAWLKREEDEDYIPCEDNLFASFLNGLIIQRRGRRPGPPAVAEQQLTNNIVLKKLKIAVNLEAEEMLEMLSEQAVKLSKHELSAFFRNPSNRHYRECKDQVLRNLLSALQTKYRPSNAPTDDDPTANDDSTANKVQDSPWSRAQSKPS